MGLRDVGEPESESFSWLMFILFLLVAGGLVGFFSHSLLGGSDRDVLVDAGCVVDDSMCLASPCVVPVYCGNVSLCLLHGTILVEGDCGG